jgi:Predicted nucleotide-binding protein containing TIR-like domain
MSKQLPEVFIGSSSEGEIVARAIEFHLHKYADVTMWMNKVFKPGVSYLQSLLNALDRFDFAVLVLTPDDVLESRDDSHSSPRDNVVFELGLFMGRLGVRRAFFVAEENKNLKLPSDLDGISRLDYRSRDDMIAAVSPACTVLINEIKKQGQLTIDKQSFIAQDSRLTLNEPLTDAENQLRSLAREFFKADYEGRQVAANRISKVATQVPLDRVLLMSDSAVPGERVAAGIALASHIKKDSAIANQDNVKLAIARGLDDSRSRVRYRYLELIANAPQLILGFRSALEVLLKEDSNEAVRLLAASALSNDPNKKKLLRF